MKRFTALFLSLILVFTMAAVAVDGGETPTLALTVSDGKGNPGGTVTLTISVDKPTAIKSLMIEPTYDAAVLEPTGGSWSVSGAAMAEWSVDEGGVLAFGDNTSVSGKIATMTFNILDTAVETTEVGLDVRVKAKIDNKESAIDSTVTAGTVTIKQTYTFDHFEWAEDYSTATAILVNTKDEQVTKEEEATVTKKVVDPTCEEDGYTVYTAKIVVEGKTYTEDQTVVDEETATGHDWDYENAYYEADEEAGIMTITVVCKNDPDHTLTEEAEIVSSETDEETGNTTYVLEFDDDDESQEFKEGLKEAVGAEEDDEGNIAVVVEPKGDDFDWEAYYAAYLEAAKWATGKKPKGNQKNDEPAPVKSDLPFTDVDPESDIYDYIKYVYEKEIMAGMSDTQFDLNGSLTRGMIMAILYRIEGSPEVAYSGKFSDVPDGEWFTNGIEWAASVGIAAGYEDGRFGPNDAVTREQLAAFLFRYANWKGYEIKTGDLSVTDAGRVSAYAVDAVKWAVENEVLGAANGFVRPTEFAKRSEIAIAIYYLLEKVAK